MVKRRNLYYLPILISVVYYSLFQLIYWARIPNLSGFMDEYYTNTIIILSTLILIQHALQYVLILTLFPKNKEFKIFSYLMLISTAAYTFFAVGIFVTLIPWSFLRYIGAFSGFLLFGVFIYVFYLILKWEYHYSFYVILYFLLGYQFVYYSFTSRFSTFNVFMNIYYLLHRMAELSIVYFILLAITTAVHTVLFFKLEKKEKQDESYRLEHDQLIPKEKHFDFSKFKNK